MLRGGGRLIVAPVLQRLILNRAPRETLDWAFYRLSKWPFKRIIPCHFTCPVEASPEQLVAAFAFLNKARTLPEEDFRVLNFLQDLLVRFKITPPPSSM
mmetsp:Transcript_36382/g.58832  ORF Transcript_36382/g.58832 Transcript_36382/m.58832 type:complete len:99 (-) Transcript_36382:336-632(-)